MFEITFVQLFVLITAVWLLVRGFCASRNKCVNWKRECLLLTVYICIVVISRIVYFPRHLVNGHIGTLKFDAGKILPLWLNYRPFTFLKERYSGWKGNIIGNIAIYIPVGICWGLCFKQLNNVFKVTLAGFGLSLFVELSQLLFYERASDIDDLILNTVGAFIGALIYFGIAAWLNRSGRKSTNEI